MPVGDEGEREEGGPRVLPENVQMRQKQAILGRRKRAFQGC